MSLRPRTIRGQLTAALVVLESIFLVLFALLLLFQEQHDMRDRAERRLQNQSATLAVVATPSIETHNYDLLQRDLGVVITSRAVLAVRITDPQGKVLAEVSKSHQPMPWMLKTQQLSNIGDDPTVLPFKLTGDLREAIMRLRDGNQVVGYAWVMQDPSQDRMELQSLLRATMIIGGLNLIGCVAISTLLARSITRPLSVLIAATRRLVRDPETQQGFPLQITESNEAADVARAFNLLVASIAEQRAGLNDTLTLLDSMLANAPVGFAFFDREYRCVRINRFLAEVSGIPVQDYLGRSVYEIHAPESAATLAAHIDTVFATGMPVREQDFRDARLVETKDGETPVQETGDDVRSWFLNVYPVRFGADSIRWIGAVFIDVTERKRAEDALRKSEKLAAAGRLAASIAHEINNPLESVTNLLYLLQRHPSLDTEARDYAELAQLEIARVSEMAQRTLRFYRQSTLPVEANVAEILDSVLMVYQGRFNALHTHVETRFDAQAELFCFAGELRQVFANLIGNALDASSEGGRLVLAVRRAHCPRTNQPGVRITVADNGCGMPPHVRRRIFEPFFTTKDATGTGLGLWITREILEKHGATISVKSRQSKGEAEGKSSGTVFTLFFPEQGVSRRTANNGVATDALAASVS
jgi:PAS domain S-box-containing protein